MGWMATGMSPANNGGRGCSNIRRETSMGVLPWVLYLLDQLLGAILRAVPWKVISFGPGCARLLEAFGVDAS